MNERATQLVELFTCALSGDQQKINIATANILQLSNDITLINELIAISINSPENSIRQYAAVLLRKMILKHLFDQGQYKLLQTSLLLLIQNDPSLDNKLLFSHAAIALDSKLAAPWEELYNLAIGFLSLPETLILGLKIFTSICDVAKTQEDFISNYFDHLMGCIISCFQTSNTEIITNAIILFQELTKKFDSERFLPYDSLPQMFLEEITAVVKDRPNLFEAQTIFNCVSFLLDKGFDNFIQAAQPFIDFALNFTVSDADIDYRIACQQVMIMAPCIFPDIVSDQLPIFLQAVYKLAIQILEVDRELVTYDINFMIDFINELIFNTETSSDVLQSLITLATNSITSQPNLIAFQVALFGLADFADYCSEELFEIDPQIITTIISFSFTSPESDNFVFDACCGFLISASENCSQIYQESYNQIISALFSHLIQQPRAIQTLDFVIYKSVQQPAGYTELLEALSGLLQSQELCESVLSCMSSVILHINEINNDIYQSMRTILIQLLSSDDIDMHTKSKVFECFGQLAKVAPLGIQEDVPALMKVLVEVLSTENCEPIVYESIAECIQKIAQIIPMSISPYLPTIIPQFLRLLSIEISTKEEEENEEEENEEDHLCAKMQCAVLKALSELVSDLPSEMQQSIPEIIQSLIHFLNSQEENLQIAAANCILLMNDGLTAVSYDASSLLPEIIDKIVGSPIIEVISELFKALGILVSSSTSHFNEEQIASIIKLFEETFNGTIETVYTSPNVLSQDILNSLFFSLRMFILTLGHNIQTNNIAQHFTSFLNTHFIKSKSSTIKAYIALTYGIMFFVAPSLKEIGTTSRDWCFKLLSKNNVYVNNIIISTLNYIISGDTTLFNEQQILTLKKQCENIIQKKDSMDSFIVGTATTMWCTIITKYDIAPPEDDLNIVLSLLSLPVDDDDIPFAAQFICIAMQKWPALVNNHIQRVAVNVFASGEWCLRIVPKEVMTALAQVISSISQEQLQIFVKHNQHYIMQIQTNLSKFSC